MKIIFLILQIIFIALSCGPSYVYKINTKEERKGIKKNYERRSTRKGVKKLDLKIVINQLLKDYSLGKNKAISIDDLLKKTSGESQEFINEKGRKVILKILFNKATNFYDIETSEMIEEEVVLDY